MKTSSNSYRNTFLRAYHRYLRFFGIQYKLKFYEEQTKEIRCPTHEKLQMIIATASKLMSLKLTISMETGLRPVEMFMLKVKDFDPEQRILYPTTAKHGAARKLKLTAATSQRLNTYIIKNDISQNCQIFRGDEVRYGKDYRVIRNRLAKKLNDPSLKNIRLYDFRHYFGTKTYLDTNSVKVAQYRLGHKHSNTTDRYTHITEDSDEWIVESTQDEKQVDQLLLKGFQYQLTTPDGYMKFRKRK